jgi:hypothetical protein
MSLSSVAATINSNRANGNGFLVGASLARAEHLQDAPAALADIYRD